MKKVVADNPFKPKGRVAGLGSPGLRRRNATDRYVPQ
jgi:hypothetical protein